ncbi:MAG TPA: hybrid sensor histidine kinase/response regulator [Thermoanaerobaculia bacterium]
MDRVRVLLIEDDEDDYVFTRDLLAEIGDDRFELEWAPTYERGLLRVLEDRFDVCLLDFRLGARTGLELLREARMGNSGAPIILMTGQGDQEIDLEAMRSGAADYLVKGEIAAAGLERSIRYAVQHRRMEEERVRLVREQEARHLAEEANRAKDEFIAMVSHELRNPLNAMLGWVTLLNSGKLDTEAQGRALTIIERNARAQAQLIDDLLDIARVASGNLRLDLRPVDLAQVVEKALDAMYPAAEAKSIAVTADLERPLEMAAGDPDRLHQVVANLFSNAVKFTPDGGAIAVSLKRDGEEARIAVRDSGDGISAAFLPHVFERFRQGEEGPGRRQGGLGLGLAIARHIVEGHGGTIRVDSPGEGQGATFTVSLPLQG